MSEDATTTMDTTNMNSTTKEIKVKYDRMIPENNIICGFIPSNTENYEHIVEGTCVEFETWTVNLSLSNITKSRRENYKHILNKNKLKQTHGLIPVYIIGIDETTKIIDVARKRITIEEENQYIANYSTLANIYKILSEVIGYGDDNNNNKNVTETKLQSIYKQIHLAENPLDDFVSGFDDYLSGSENISSYKEFDLNSVHNIQIAEKIYNYIDFKTINYDFKYILNHLYASDILTLCLHYMTTIEIPNGDRNFKCTFEKKNYKLSIQTKIETRAMKFLKECKTKFEQFIKEQKQTFKTKIEPEKKENEIHEEQNNEKQEEQYGKYGKQPTSNLMIIGNVAAGKTTLTKCLTGKSTLTSSEEQKTLHTKELGYASFNICKCSNPECNNICPVYYDSVNFMCDKCIDGILVSSNFINIMDCPGHKAFMKHAISGTKNIDYLIVVISATEGCHEQTFHHLSMCEMVGFKDPSKILVLLNKSELVLDKLQTTIDTVKMMLEPTIAGKSPIYPISAISGKGLNKIYEWLSILPNKTQNNDTTIFPIIRSFNSNKCGTTDITGGIIGVSGISGNIKLNDTIYINPGIYDKNKNTCTPIETIVTSIRTETTVLEQASSGGCVAIGTHIDPQLTTSNFMVGMVASDKPLMVADHCKIENINFAIKHMDLYSDKSYTCSPAELFNKNIKIQFLTHLITADVEKYSKSKNYAKVKFDKPIAITYRSQIVALYTTQFELIGNGRIIFEGCDMPDEDIDNIEYQPIQYDSHEIVAEFNKISEASEKTKISIPKPHANMATNSKVLIHNAYDIVASVNRNMDLLTLYIKKELNVVANINAKSIQIHMKMSRHACEKNVSNLIKKFMVKYVQCKQCKSLHTTYKTHDTFLCNDCNSMSSIHK